MRERIILKVFGVLPSLFAIGLIGLLIYKADLHFGSTFDTAFLQSLEVLGSFIAVGMVSAFLLKLLLQPRTARSGRNAAPPVRDRLAREVVYIGSAGIVGVSVVLLFMINTKSDAYGTTGLSIFTAVLPVFSTWVGTVLASYFTNESFRQAAESSQQDLPNRGDLEPITRPGTMVEFARIIRYELVNQTATIEAAEAAAEVIPLSTFIALFQPPGVTRIIVFDADRHPVFVLRHEALPPAPAANATLKGTSKNSLSFRPRT
jgi:hypothetical protein